MYFLTLPKKSLNFQNIVEFLAFIKSLLILTIFTDVFYFEVSKRIS